nr:hypothetical protein [bacterium]
MAKTSFPAARLLLMLIALLSLAGCSVVGPASSPVQDATPSVTPVSTMQPTPLPTPDVRSRPVECQIPFSVKFVGTPTTRPREDYGIGLTFDYYKLHVIKSTAGLKEYIRKQQDYYNLSSGGHAYGPSDAESFEQAVAGYDEAFFEKQCLVLVAIKFQSSWYKIMDMIDYGDHIGIEIDEHFPWMDHREEMTQEEIDALHQLEQQNHSWHYILETNRDLFEGEMPEIKLYILNNRIESVETP